MRLKLIFNPLLFCFGWKVTPPHNVAGDPLRSVGGFTISVACFELWVRIEGWK